VVMGVEAGVGSGAEASAGPSAAPSVIATRAAQVRAAVSTPGSRLVTGRPR